MLKRKSEVHGDSPKITIGYKYNGRKVLYLIVTEEAGSTESGILYLSKYHDPFAIVDIHTVACTLVMYKFFGYVNEVDSHKKPRQYNLALKKYMFTQSGCIRLCMTVSIGITITNF